MQAKSEKSAEGTANSVVGDEQRKATGSNAKPTIGRQPHNFPSGGGGWSPPLPSARSMRRWAQIAHFMGSDRNLTIINLKSSNF
ncbi:hypothetical protein niasHT_016048 [Heterodera trifolii]|uniref:Uncharacterized protein n=1 Tax=Heterodera trifolii TaxID=157864 RepID=A0ABD2LEZ0_9BILA